MSRRSRSAPRTRRRSRPSSKPSPIPGPSLIIAYSHCIAHGYDMAHGLEQQKMAVESGYWPLYRYDPRRAANGEAPLMLDSADPKAAVDRLLAAE